MKTKKSTEILSEEDLTKIIEKLNNKLSDLKKRCKEIAAGESDEMFKDLKDEEITMKLVETLVQLELHEKLSFKG